MLTLLLLGSACLSLMYRGPLDRLFLMILELQIMTNLALFHVTMPANYEIWSQISKPFVALNFVKDNEFLMAGLTQSKDSSDESLEFLG